MWVDPASGPAAVTLDAAGNDANAADSDQIVSTSPTGKSITIDVLSGETVSVSEAFDTTAGKLGAENYDTTLDCTGGSTSSRASYDDQLVIADSPSPITCTFTNTRKSTTLTLQKAWVKPVTGDQVTLSIDGTNDDTSGAVVAPATTETASTTVYAGETITISEAIAAGNTAIYDVDSITCSAGTVGWSGVETDKDATVAVSAANVASPITCTITNSAQRGTIVVVKNTDGGNGTFHFAGTWAGASGFELTTVGGTSSTILHGRARAEAGRLQRRRDRPDAGVRRHQRHLHRHRQAARVRSSLGGQAADRLDRPRRRRDRHLHVHQHRAGDDRDRQGRPAQLGAGLRVHHDRPRHAVVHAR